MAAAASRPDDLPRVAPTVESVESSNESQMKVKKNRQSESGALPGMNDILTGLLNVVGEGLTIATNFVKEENERKKEAASKSVKEKEASLLAAQLELASVSAVPALLKPGRINNRGPPRLSEIPFEAIPLEILNSQLPGQNPVQIQQRPFQTRIKITKTKLPPGPPFATGIPLPEVLIPGFEMPTTTDATTEVVVTEETTEASKEVIDRIDEAAPDKLENKYRPLVGLSGSSGDDLELKPSKTTSTITATATRRPPIWPLKPIRNSQPLLRPGNIEATRRPQIVNTPPLLQRPFPKPSSSIVIKPIVDRNEVLYAGQAFDVKPTREPLPEVFDLVVTAQQNFGSKPNSAVLDDGT